MVDFEQTNRGFLGRLEPMSIPTAEGRVVWDMDDWGFLDADCPETVNPSLWRQSQLTAMQGLFEVTEGMYQVRGLDMSNMTLVEGDTGVIVIDPLISAEFAAAALALYRAHRGERPVTGVIYTHAHLDHFGGVLGVVDADTDVPIIAPEHFMEHAVSENVYAGHGDAAARHVLRRLARARGRATGLVGHGTRCWRRRPERSGCSPPRWTSRTPVRRRRRRGPDRVPADARAPSARPR